MVESCASDQSDRIHGQAIFFHSIKLKSGPRLSNMKKNEDDRVFQLRIRTRTRPVA